MHPDTTSQPAERKRHKPMRSCAGCGRSVSADELVRVVVGPDSQVAFDLAGHCFGRGAHVHPAKDCLHKAAKRGLSRSFKCEVHCEPDPLCLQLVDAANRRIRGLIGSAVRSGRAAIGHQAVQQALEQGKLALLIVATDAPAAVRDRAMLQAASHFAVVGWGTKSELGAWVGHPEVALLGIRSLRIGAAIAAACRIADGARFGAEVR